MKFVPLSGDHAKDYNKVISHPLQSYEWGTFREKTGIKIIRQGVFHDNKLTGGFTMTIHRIPKTSWNIGYIPKGPIPDKKMLDEIRVLGKKEKCIFVQLEPNECFSEDKEKLLTALSLKKAAHPLFTQYTFMLDLTKAESDLLKNLHPKTRYNIKVAQKHNVTIVEKNTDDAFQKYLELMQETTKRQKFYAHSLDYHKIQWQVLSHIKKPEELSSHLLVANYNMKTLAAWILFVFKDTLYYPYGASSNEHRETMASTLMMWEAIKFGQKMGLKKFDMWGALGQEPDPLDPWFGFHRFKQGFRPEHIMFIGSYDLVIQPILYQAYVAADKIRSFFLHIK